MSKFVHLHCHTQFSLLESPLRAKQLLDKCEEYGMDTVAITDNGAMYGVIDFYLKAKKKGIKPIIGCDMYLCPDMTVKSRGLDRLVLLCKDYTGYQNLIKLVTMAHLDGFYYKPRIDLKHLAEHTEGLIAISPAGKGPVGYNIRSNKEAEARDFAIKLKEIYGSDFYLGLQKLDVAFEDVVNEDSIKLSKELDIPVVATNDVYYITDDRAAMRNVLMCIQTGKRLEDDARIQFQSQEAWVKSPAAMAELFKDVPEAIDNTRKIADMCNIEIETEQVHLPRFECPDNLSSEDYLRKLVLEGTKEKYGEITNELQERIDFELKIINSMHYAPYFLIIYDFLDFTRKSNIPIGPGRGSAAGSIVAYALNITDIDPIRYKLLFERFLNPERVSMPDIDLDFCIRRRGEVIDYIVQKYGEERVSQIITFGTMAARGVVRDVGRVLNIPLIDVDRIAKLIPSTPGQYTSIPEALEQIPELKKLYDTNEDYKELLDTGAELEGVCRHTSTHAAGVVISRDPLTDVVPLIKNDGQVSTQFSMGDIEKVGLLKMDILGLRNLTVMDDATRLIKENHNVELDLSKLDMEDKATYELLCKGQAIGVFQLESRGMRQLIKDMQPEVFEDLIALLALYRPGPLGSGMVSEFVSNKSGKTEVKYDLPELEPILSETYGMIVYQEQVMQIASTIGGFSLGQADMLRRAMGKKKKDVMDEMADEFLAGAKAKNLPADKAKKIFDLCYKFAEYGFNKSHSAAYALISFQTAYLKANYPKEYMTALLSSVIGFSDKTSLYIQESLAMNMEVLQPDVNESRADFTTVEKGIRFGLGAIKNVGEGAIESIVEQRQDKPYKNLSDFCLRVDLKQVNKRVLESLIKSGAMDSIGDRSQLLSCYDKVLERAQVIAKERNNGQTSMFSQVSMVEGNDFRVEDADYDILNEQEKLRMEKDMLGLYLTGHPLNEHQALLDAMPDSTDSFKPGDESRIVEIAGILTDCRRVVTRTKKEMLIGTLEDLRGSVSVLMFQNDEFEEIAKIFEDDNIVKVSGRMRSKEDEVSISINQITLVDQLQQERQFHLDIAHVEDLSLVQEIKKIIRHNRGGIPVFIHIGETTIQSHKKYWINDDAIVWSQIENLLGQGRVWAL